MVSPARDSASRLSTKAMSRIAPRGAISGWSGYRARATAHRTTSVGPSADQWPALAAELSARTGISVGHERPGGVHLCLGGAELEERRARMEGMRIQSGNFGFEYRMLDR